jgi:hypothetical protein
MTPYAQKELEAPTTPLKRGDSGPKVRQVQEWLCLHGHHTAVDGDFGPATEAAMKAFQQTWDGADSVLIANADGLVGAATWRALTEPMRRVVEWEREDGQSDVGAVITCARAHLAASPREVGGPNAGTWVRYYCRGQEVPWCAGFATTVLGQALGHDDWYTLSCDELAAKAKERGKFISGANPHVRGVVRPGCLFLIRAFTPVPQDDWRHRDDWIHTGIVTAVGDGYFETVEGNTYLPGKGATVNAARDRNGDAVHQRTRSFGPNVDFVLMGER